MGRWLQQFFHRLDSDVAEPLRIRLFRLMCATTCGISLLVILPLNLFIGLPDLVSVAVVVLGLCSGLCYWASRRGQHYFHSFFGLVVVLLVPVWFLNAGAEGSITYYFFAAVLYPLAIMRGRTRWLVAALLGLIALSLPVVEYYHPAWVVPFSGPVGQLLDLTTGIFCCYLLIVVIVGLILSTYDREQLRLSALARELAASEQNYREIFNATSDAMIVRDATGRLIDANDRMLALYGYDRAALATLSIRDLSLGTSPYSEREALQLIQRTITEGPQIFIWRCRRRNGDLFWAEIALRACEINGQQRVISAVRDISLRLQAQEALRTNEERLRLALAASHQGWFDLNVVTGEGIASEEYARIIGENPAEFKVTAQSWLENIHPEDRRAVAQEFQTCLTTGEVRTMEYRRRTAAGGWKWIRSIGKIVEYDAGGKPLRMAGTHTDITERKTMEAQLLHSQRLESVGTLAAGVAHDLNNILTPMLMASSVLEGKLVDPQDRELMGLLENGAKRGAGIVRQLLSFSRDLAQSRVPVDVGRLIREMRDIMRATFPPGITVAVQLPAGLWRVTADPIQLHQVLMNLCLNARDAMPAGGTLTLAAANLQLEGEGAQSDPWSRGGRYVSITVTDTGEGIAPEILNRIFDPFFSTKAAGKGTGLGLSTVFGIVKGHGGSISVDSRPQHGASFKVILPAGDSSPTGADGATPPP